ncbi:MAG TPA: DUF6596 domain-containing protein [Longimicrobiales bacterium]|nr:DUF6596 domain-containing protein [Longimicrobiales bacterium]
MKVSETITGETDRVLRDAAPQVLAAIARRHADFAAAEDAVQEALIAASQQWPAHGIPSNPQGWLYRVAFRRLTDHVRAEFARRNRENAIAVDAWADWAFVPPHDVDVAATHDDSLTLLFMCCHPSLTPTSAIALTLRAVGGLTTAEIASAFLVPEATMAQRISRAKQTIRSSGEPFRMPVATERGERLCAVMQVIYLVFNEGYATSAGPSLQRVDLAEEAIRLGRMLHSLVPDEPEVSGLLALMLLTDARRRARTGPHGELVPLDEQDRTLWNADAIREGTALVEHAFRQSAVGPYQLQAAIAALHDAAPSFAETDWPQILALYQLLERMTGNPVVTLNRAIATAMVHGPGRGLAIIDDLREGPRLRGNHRLDAVQGHLYEMLGDTSRAAEHYAAAAQLTKSIPERDYLQRKAAAARERG